MFLLNVAHIHTHTHTNVFSHLRIQRLRMKFGSKQLIHHSECFITFSFHQSCKLTHSDRLSFIAPCQLCLGTSIHSRIFCFRVILSALSIQRCLKYRFPHILTWELNHLQLRDQDAAAYTAGLGDAMLPCVSQVCLTLFNGVKWTK